MKTNGEMNHGGLLQEEYYDAWAKLIVRYLLAYREEGIEIGRVTVQNEPAAVQTWDSCIFQEHRRQFLQSEICAGSWTAPDWLM